MKWFKQILTNWTLYNGLETSVFSTLVQWLSETHFFIITQRDGTFYIQLNLVFFLTELSNFFYFKTFIYCTFINLLNYAFIFFERSSVILYFIFFCKSFFYFVKEVLWLFYFSKFRGSTIVICIWAFGVFFAIGGALMIYLGYFYLDIMPFWLWSKAKRETESIPPIQIAGPLLFCSGLFLSFIGLIFSISHSQVFFILILLWFCC